ncbi:MAG TPA: hypothetical protein VJP80_02900 [Candidatus Saccharimonadales bacterium]|nr:hypothetical protein [Candidatus Saccharimonadales bacterium]
MSLETNQWTELTNAQGMFFHGQLDAARQIAFSATAHEAGIVPIHASRFSYRVKGHAEVASAILWPDPYEQDTICAVAGHADRSANQGFVRITSSPESYLVEGVALNMTYGRGSNLFGRQLHLRHDLSEQARIPHVVTEFLGAARHHADEQSKTASLSTYVTSKPELELLGIDGDTSARLFRSLGSLSANLVVVGSTNEKPSFGDSTYDLAQILYKMAVNNAVTERQTSDGSTKSHLVWDSSGKLRGAIFSTPEGLAAVRRLDTYPDTISVARVARPTTIHDSLLFVEEYAIQARGVSYNVTTLPVEAYDMQAIISAVTSMNVAAQKKTPTASVEPRTILNSQGQRLLEQQILQLINNRANEAVL